MRVGRMTMTFRSEEVAVPKYCRGEDHYRTDLTEEDVRQIRALVELRDYHRQQALALSYDRIGEKFDLTGNHVRKIHLRLLCRHVP